MMDKIRLSLEHDLAPEKWFNFEFWLGLWLGLVVVEVALAVFEVALFILYLLMK
jgi:hypothetical protein